MINRVKQQLHVKLMVLFTIVIMIPLLIFTTFTYSKFVDGVKTNYEEKSQNELQAISDKVNNKLSQINDFCTLCRTDPELKETILRFNRGAISLDEFNKQIERIIGHYSTVLPFSVVQTAFLGQDKAIYGNTVISSIFCNVQPENYPWNHSPNYVSLGSNCSWYYEQSDSNSYSSSSAIPSIKNFYVKFPLYDTRGHFQLGNVIIMFNQSELINMYSSLVKSPASIFILDLKENIFVSTYSDPYSFSSKFPQYSEKLDRYSGSFIYEDQGDEILVNISTLNATHWNIISVSNINRSVDYFLQAKNAFFAGIIIICLLFFTVFYLIINRTTLPIRKLSAHMKNMDEKALSLYASDISDDEIGYLATQFNTLITRIKNLMLEMLDQQEEKRKSDIAALQTQIHPHFLINTLASVRYLIAVGKATDADRALLNLTKMIQNMFSDSDPYTTIGLSIEQLKTYISIQAMRMDNMPNIIYNISHDIYDCLILKLLIQPVVENSFIHGFTADIENPTINITGYSKDSSIFFVISDNGVGFDPRRIIDPLKGLFSKGHHALYNIDNRLKLNFGASYGIRIESTPNKETKVILSFPKMYYERGIKILDDSHS